MSGVMAGGAGNTFQAGKDSIRNARSPYRRGCAPSRRRCFSIPTDTPGGNRRKGSRRRLAVPGKAGMAHGGAVWAARWWASLATLIWTRGDALDLWSDIHSGRGLRSCRRCGLVHPSIGGPEPLPASKGAFAPGRDGLAPGRRRGYSRRPRARLGARRWRSQPCGLVHPGNGGLGPLPTSKGAFASGRDGLARRRRRARPGRVATGRVGATWVEYSALGGRCQGARGDV